MFTIRQMTKDDVAFVYSSWLRSLRPHVPVLKYLFFKQQHAMLEYILGQPTTRVLVACLTDSPEVVLGWLCVQDMGPKEVVHFVYTKQDFRRMSIAGALLKAADLGQDPEFTHYTPAVRYFGRYAPIYNPFVLMRSYRD